MDGQIIDTIRILGIQNNNYDFLNPINISISSDIIIQELTKCRKYRYRFLLESLLFSSNIENNTNVIFVSCNGLNNEKKALVNSKLINILCVCYLTELKDWELVKGQPKRLQAVFTDSEERTKTPHLGFAFITWNISDLLNFTITVPGKKLHSRQRKKIAEN